MPDAPPTQRSSVALLSARMHPLTSRPAADSDGIHRGRIRIGGCPRLSASAPSQGATSQHVVRPSSAAEGMALRTGAGAWAGPPSGRFTGRASCGASACASRCTCGTRTVEARVLPRVSSRRRCSSRGLRPRPRGGQRVQGAPGGLPDLVVRAHADPVGDRAVLLHLLRQRHLHLEPLVRRHVSCERRGREAGRVGRCEAAPKAVRNVQSGRLGWERWLPRSCSMCSPRAL